MIRRRAILIGAGTCLVAGCIGGDGTGPEPDDADDAGAGGDQHVRTYAHDEHGDILVGPNRMTLYMFDADSPGSQESSCYDPCSSEWPPLLIDGPPMAGEGVEAELSTFERTDGETQGAANGRPLYYHEDDEEIGATTGQGANDAWWILDPSGNPIQDDGASG